MSVNFDIEVRPGGYAWWYVDAWSDDGLQGLTLIAFVGSVFSPYYAMARRRAGGPADGLDHCSVNLALYASEGSDAPRAWCMTERGKRHVRRAPHALVIGPSALGWDAGALTVSVDERAVPWPRPMRGTIRLESPQWRAESWQLDATGHHRWRPIAPHARVEVDFRDPASRWSGHAYFDANHGDRPLAEDFESWQWSRAARSGGNADVAYDVITRSGEERRLALSFPRMGPARAEEPASRHALPRSGWRLDRIAASQEGPPPRVVQTLEDGPFYARSRISCRMSGEDCIAMHESLSLTRWERPIVQAMLPFRMPRRR